MARATDVVSVYVLKLAGDRFYVGSTARPGLSAHLERHMTGDGSAWTRLYECDDGAPHETFHDCSRFDEDKHVVRLMEMHGIDNVRGGMYADVDLPPWLRKCAERAINHGMNRCLRCGDASHSQSDCSESDNDTSSDDDLEAADDDDMEGPAVEEEAEEAEAEEEEEEEEEDDDSSASLESADELIPLQKCAACAHIGQQPNGTCHACGAAGL